MKNFIYLLLIFILVSCSIEKYPAIPKGATVVILGDSLSYGTGASEGEDYPNLLAKTTGWQIINAGIPGNTSADGLEQLPRLLTAHRPKLLVVALGGNDFLQRLPSSETTANLKAILEQAKTQGITAVLVAVPELSPLKAAVGSLSDHPLYKKIAEETATPLVKNVFSEVLSDNSLKADQVHPNASGYGVVSGQMFEALKKLGFAG
ncbi:GDSL-type esterase/lipase family protein [Methylotenera sp.]|uniref:GDSL-type esterase/lipase family protein n=1 Tax=Methylotenera sp. TaxID=2051956 RepID=UPI00272F28A5|nr:GDSL-type esterase/lipase family protein [Methylotenera sp.]MDP2072364.1 GDSL-type esterase/lipase family protein [Methylotenera sp.]MDP2229392.1 GDSL-type esterase/lipase family protein [Methylotenera sp.]MDP3005607.1 GDSL-type esterase/lipase family protein [Methylotenera sp.]MDP3141967.1 GDSL-type esterase/lipase family protein [Methylotenera sp.]